MKKEFVKNHLKLAAVPSIMLDGLCDLVDRASACRVEDWWFDRKPIPPSLTDFV